MAQMASIALENSRLYNEIRVSDARKDEFLATLAHELRNPLAPISNALAGPALPRPPGQSRQPRGIERQVAQLVHLVDDLLDVSRVSRGKLDLRRRACSSSERPGQRDRDEPARHRCPRAPLQVRQLPVEPVWLDADLDRLAQVFANLLNNSAKYMEPGGTIVVQAARAAEQEVVVSVQRHRHRHRPEMLPHVFDMFVQADRSLERAHGGLGIGLTLVRRLVELHGGTGRRRAATARAGAASSSCGCRGRQAATQTLTTPPSAPRECSGRCPCADPRRRRQQGRRRLAGTAAVDCRPDRGHARATASTRSRSSSSSARTRACSTSVCRG